jgi:DNA-binding MarR family transcriptional regulator
VARGANAAGYFAVTPKPEGRSARAYPESRRRSPLALDRLIHERLRLGIVGALAVNDRLTFNHLKRLLQTTDGNLSVHARKLEEAGYVTAETISEGRAQTEYRLTSAGRRAFEKYLSHMEAIIKAVRD